MIRSLMERSTRWAGLPASACFVAAALAAGAAAGCAWMGWSFDQEKTLALWLVAAALALAQFAGFTVAGALRRREPPFSRLTWAALFSMLPGLFAGAALTFAVAPAQRPGAWMLSYGAAVCGLGYFLGPPARWTGALFLAAGALALLALPDRGVLMMGLSFGGLHALLGILLIFEPKENHEAVLFDEIEDR
jgi:hypothetical protein